MEGSLIRIVFLDGADDPLAGGGAVLFELLPLEVHFGLDGGFFAAEEVDAFQGLDHFHGLAVVVIVNLDAVRGFAFVGQGDQQASLKLLHQFLFHSLSNSIE